MAEGNFSAKNANNPYIFKLQGVLAKITTTSGVEKAKQRAFGILKLELLQGNQNQIAFGDQGAPF